MKFKIWNMAESQKKFSNVKLSESTFFLQPCSCAIIYYSNLDTFFKFTRYYHKLTYRVKPVAPIFSAFDAPIGVT